MQKGIVFCHPNEQDALFDTRHLVTLRTPPNEVHIDFCGLNSLPSPSCLDILQKKKKINVTRKVARGTRAPIITKHQES